MRGSLPPSIVLEVLKITEGEMELRDQTRELEQARTALEDTLYLEQAELLADHQDDLALRTELVIEKILELPDAEQEFGQELEQLGAAGAAMDDALAILDRPSTGPAAIAAETEAIEHLLRARRSSGGGGGGGSSPGRSAAGGAATASALALAGRSNGESDTVGERGVAMATGAARSNVPEEFRDGLDRFFEAIEDRGE